MKKGLKRGQLNLSFSMIFTIIIIIVTIAVASYVIIKFLNVNKCQEIGTFYSDLDKEATKAVNAGLYSGDFSAKLNSFNGKIKAICFGNLTQQTLTREDFLKQQELADLGNQKNNVFIYPNSEACDVRFASKKVQYISTDNFFCVNLVNGGMKVRVSMNPSDVLVKLSKP